MKELTFGELLKAVTNCGCGGKTKEDEEKEIKRIEKEIEEAEGGPLVEPIDPVASLFVPDDYPELPIVAPDVFQPRRVKVEELVPA